MTTSWVIIHKLILLFVYTILISFISLFFLEIFYFIYGISNVHMQEEEKVAGDVHSVGDFLADS